MARGYAWVKNPRPWKLKLSSFEKTRLLRLPDFDAPFARLRYFPSGRFSLWALRHTEEWIVLDDDITPDQCLEQLRINPWFER